MHPLLIHALLIATAIVPALALEPIDDFEEGPFSFATFGAYQQHSVSVDAPGHTITTQREVILAPTGPQNSITVDLTVGVGDDAAEVAINGDGTVRFDYNLSSPRDITQGGDFDRIELTFSNVTPGAYFRLGLGDGTISCAENITPTGSSGTVSWDLDDFCSGVVDLTETELITLHLKANGSDATFTIEDLRLHRRISIRPDILGNFLATQVPPIPSPPLAWSTYDWTAQPLVRTDVVFDSVIPVGGTADMTGNLQVQAEPSGDIARTTFYWNDPPGFFEATFQMSIDFSPANGWAPEIIYPPDPVHGPGGLVVNTGVLLRDGGGVPRGTSCIRIVFTDGTMQDISFDNVSVVSVSTKSAVMNGIDLTFTLTPTNMDYVFPLFEVEWLADWVEIDPTGVTTPMPAGENALRLVASPSVTRGGTEIRLSAPIEASSEIEIYDVSGRLVRLLGVSAGSTAVSWDGRSSSGTLAASGLYFARMGSDFRTQGGARIVKVR